MFQYIYVAFREENIANQMSNNPTCHIYLTCERRAWRRII